MQGKIQSTDFGGLTPPEQFLLHDESALEYTERLSELMADLAPANYLDGDRLSSLRRRMWILTDSGALLRSAYTRPQL